MPDEHRRGLRVAVVLLVAAALAQGAGIALLLPVFRAVGDGRSPWSSLVVLVAIWIAWAVTQMAGVALARSHGYALAGVLLADIGAQVGRMPPGLLNGPAVGIISRLAIADVMSLITRPAHLLDPLIGASITPTAALIVAAFIDPVVGLLGLLLLPFVLAAYLWCGRRVERGEGALHEVAADTAARIVELAEQQPVLRSAGRVGEHAEYVARALADLDRRQRRLLRNAIPALAGYVIAIQCMTAILIAAVGVAALHGRTDAAGVLVLAILIARATEQLLHAGEHAGASRLAAAAQRRIEQFLGGPQLPEPTVPAEPQAIRADLTGLPVVLEDATVVYQDGTQALRSANFVIDAGTTVAVVGESGAGKSTIMQLLTRMLEPTSGRVLLGGIDTRELGTEGVARLVAPVFQHTYLFDDTLFANVAVGHPDAPMAVIEAAAAAAGLDELVARLPDGWRSRVGEGGTLLSSGERQRVAIARAIAKQAPILVLDEFTSVLDAHTEAAVIATLRDAVVGATVVIVTHSPAVTATADVVVTIAGGHAVRVERRQLVSESSE